MTDIEKLLEHVRAAQKSLFYIDQCDEFKPPVTIPCLESFVRKLYIIEGWLLCIQNWQPSP